MKGIPVLRAIVGAIGVVLLVVSPAYASVLGSNTNNDYIASTRAVNDDSGISIGTGGAWSNRCYTKESNPDLTPNEVVKSVYLQLWADQSYVDLDPHYLIMTLRVYATSTDCGGHDGDYTAGGTTAYTAYSANADVNNSSSPILAFDFSGSGIVYQGQSYGVTVSVYNSQTGEDLYWYKSYGSPDKPWIHISSTPSNVSTSTVNSSLVLTDYFDLSGCSILQFDFLGCMSTIFGWSTSAMSAGLSELNTQIFEIWPLGYVSRFFSIISGTATSTVPSIQLSLPGILTGTSTIDIQTAMDSASVILNTDSEWGYSFWDVFMPFWYVLMYSTLVIACIFTVLGFKGKKSENI